MRVLYPEGTVHEFLALRNAAGTVVSYGDLIQIPRDGAIESRMVFTLPDGSLFDERVTFTQRGVFSMRSYRLVQRGPSFPDDLDASLSGERRIRREGEGARRE